MYSKMICAKIDCTRNKYSFKDRDPRLRIGQSVALSEREVPLDDVARGFSEGPVPVTRS